MNQFHRCSVLSVLVFLPCGLLACRADTSHEVNPVVQNPLPLDPTEEYDFRGWWQSDERMLVLNRDQSYVYYDGLNRYLSRQQRGRWSELTYASIRLEPYGRYAPEPMRVRVRLIEGQRALLVDGQDPMFAVEEPPRTPEDELLGAWGGDSGELILSSDMRYSYTPSSKWFTAHATVLPAGQRGSWRLAGDELTLRPDSPSFKSVLLKHTEQDDVEQLTGETLAFERETGQVADSGAEANEANAGNADSTAVVSGDEG